MSSELFTFQNQSKWRLRMILPIDLTGADSAVFHCEKADGATASFTATFEQRSPTGIVYFDTNATNASSALGAIGESLWWPEIGWGTAKAYGKAIAIQVYSPGQT